MKVAIWFVVNIIFVGISLYYVISRQLSRGSIAYRLAIDHGSGKSNFSDHVTRHKHKIISQLRLSLYELNKNTEDGNYYSAHYSGRRQLRQSSLTWRKILCDLKDFLPQSHLKTMIPDDESPFHPNRSRLLKDSQFQLPDSKKTCVIVSSAGSLLYSGMGSFIDGHDYVIRFNNAPTFGYEEDVGAKTNLRIVNSQVVAREDFQFTSSSLYKNVSLIVWDPSKYKADLSEWAEDPDFPFLDSFFGRREVNPEEDLFLLDPRGLWELWDFLSKYSPVPIPPNPPSSGFIGLVLMLPWCDYVDMVEYVPSLRMTERCHYYDPTEDLGCTIGDWHPLAAEKLLALNMNGADDVTVFQDGYIRVPGLKTISCG